MKISEFPIATRPMEFIALSVFIIHSVDGDIYFYFAIDAFSGFVIHIGTDRNDNPETLIKHVYLLTENSAFILNRKNEYTLVFEKYEELSDKIKAIIIGVNGKLIIDKEYNYYISNRRLSNLKQYIESRI